MKRRAGWAVGGPPVELSVGGNTTCSPVEMAGLLNTHFVDKIVNLKKKLNEDIEKSSAILDQCIL